jgi:acetyl esterase/lipase
MTARIRRLELTLAERRAVTRGNAALALVPRLKADGWRLSATQWLSNHFGATAARVTAAQLNRRGVRVETVHIPSEDGGVSIRILNPPGPPRGVVLDMHGGGWVVGSAGLNDHLNADLALETGLAVVSVDYRLLSEPRGVLMQHALSDCMAAGRWLAENARARFGTDRLFLSGQSAGAHLAALTAVALRDEGRFGAFRGCVMTYGVYDLSGTPSARAAGPETLVLNGPTLASDLGRLTPDRDEAGRRRPDISPLYADLRDLPPAFFVSGELDPLRDDSRLMAEAWSGDTELLQVPLAPHGFIHFGGPLAVRSLAEIQAWLERRLMVLEAA